VAGQVQSKALAACRVIELLAVAKAREADVLADPPELEQQGFKRMLRSMIARLSGSERPR